MVKALLGKTVIADTSLYSTGGVGELGTTASSAAIQGCDTLLIVGSTMPWLHYYPKPGQARIVQIDRDPTRLGLRVAVDVPIVGDVRRTLTDLLPLLEPQGDRTFFVLAPSCNRLTACASPRRAAGSVSPARPEEVGPALEAAWRIADRRHWLKQPSTTTQTYLHRTTTFLTPSTSSHKWEIPSPALRVDSSLASASVVKKGVFAFR